MSHETPAASLLRQAEAWPRIEKALDFAMDCGALTLDGFHRLEHIILDELSAPCQPSSGETAFLELRCNAIRGGLRCTLSMYHDGWHVDGTEEEEA